MLIHHWACAHVYTPVGALNMPVDGCCQNSEPFIVRHYLYKDWPDHGTPPSVMGIRCGTAHVRSTDLQPVVSALFLPLQSPPGLADCVYVTCCHCITFCEQVNHGGSGRYKDRGVLQYTGHTLQVVLQSAVRLG